MEAEASRRSPRNRAVAEGLQDAGLATLLMDLLTPGEEAVDVQTARLRFDFPLLAARASTGAAAALMAAAERPERVGTVVSRGGRPDLAAAALPRRQAPTLLIVGAADPVVLELNREALNALRAEKRLEVVPGASHLFEEPGALERVTGLARDWFVHHLVAPVQARRAAG
jgi:pimeloyl-ACP methyl ester carboxylesterase